MSGRNRWRLLDWLVAVLLGVGALVLYALTLAPTVLSGDGGEFQFVPYLLGVAHPTGYPLYTLLGWIWSRLLPIGDVAYRMNLFSAFWAALAVALLYPTTRSMLRQALPALPAGIQRLVAALTAATFALTPTLWSQAVIAEVYGLQTCLLVALLYSLLVWAERRDSRLLLLSAFGFGLGLAHHSTTVLFAPAILVYLWLVDRRVFYDWRFILKALLLLIIPLALYLLIPLRAPHTPYLELPLAQDRTLLLYQNSLANFLHFVLGGPFGGSVDLSVDLGQRLAMAVGFLLNEIGWVGIVLALAGVGCLAYTRKWALLGLTGLAYLASVAFNLVYTIGDIYVLFIPSYLLQILWMAIGAGCLVRPLFSKPIVAALLVVLFFTLPLWTAASQYPDADQSWNRQAHTRWEAILAEPLPRDAVLVSNDRNNMMPMWYFQYVDGVRTDLLGLFPLITPEYPSLGHILDLALSTGRPAYLIKEMPGVEVKVKVEAEGSLWRVAGSAVEGDPAYSGSAHLADAVALVGYDRSPRSPRPGEDLQVSLYWEALRPLEAQYHSFVHLIDAEGQVVAQSDRQPGGVHYPTSLWRPGERLRDDHSLTIPTGAPAGVYELWVGMYTLASDGALVPLGQPAVAGQVAIKASTQAEPGPISEPVRANFGDQVELLGYDAVLQGRTLGVVLHWHSIQPPTADYTVFVHLVDANGQTVAQHDGQPQGGAYPTSVWDTNEVVQDEHALLLPPDLPDGDYYLRVGLYLLETGERLQVEGGGDSLELGPLDAKE